MVLKMFIFTGQCDGSFNFFTIVIQLITVYFLSTVKYKTTKLVTWNTHLENMVWYNNTHSRYEDIEIEIQRIIVFFFFRTLPYWTTTVNRRILRYTSIIYIGRTINWTIFSKVRSGLFMYVFVCLRICMCVFVRVSVCVFTLNPTSNTMLLQFEM